MSIEESDGNYVLFKKKIRDSSIILDVALLDRMASGKEKFNLVLLDLNQYFVNSKIEMTEKSVGKGLVDVSSVMTKIEATNQWLKFKESIEVILSYCHLILSEDGFLAVIVNGTIKAYIKQILDKVFRIRNFVNEIVIDSPLKIYYGISKESFDRTSYILLYSKKMGKNINAVLNNKMSGGYWHSFVSKGQGKAKKFIFNGEEIVLAPPMGTHWKLKQETITKMCKEGKIRLNRNGNPEYWVTPKKGQIVDTNWLDIKGLEISKEGVSASEECLDRLFKLCLLKEKRVFAILSDDMALKSVAKANRVDFLEDERDIKSSDIKAPEILVSNSNKDVSNNSREGENVRSEELKLLDCNILDIESYHSETSMTSETHNIVIKGDNLRVLSCLVPEFEAKFKLIYIDPPFLTGTHENIVVPLKSEKKGSYHAIHDRAYENISIVDNQIKYIESWFRERAKWMKRMLRRDGFLFVRFDYHFGHYAKIILDQLFGSENFVNEFIVRRMKKNVSRRNLNRQQHLIVHYDSLFAYRASDKARLNTKRLQKTTRKNQDKVELEYNNDNIWVDITGYEKVKKTLYPTENSEALLRRVISISTEEGDLVGDFFAGSGTTLAVAEEMNRRWVGIDIGTRSVHEIKKRILRRENYRPFIYKEMFSTNEKKEVFLPVHKFESLRGNRYKFSFLEDKLDLKIDMIVRINLLKSVLNLRLRTFCPSSKKCDKKYNFTTSELIDYWGVDWNCDGDLLNISWSSVRKLRGKKIVENVVLKAKRNFENLDQKISIGVLIVDVYGVPFRIKLVIPPPEKQG